MANNEDEAPTDKSEVRSEAGQGLVWSVQRRAYDFPGKLYSEWELKQLGEGDNHPDQPDDWFDIKD